MAKAKTTKTPETKKEAVTVQVQRLNKQHQTVTLFGDSPLIVHAWTQKGKLEMLAKHMQLPRTRSAKDPWELFLGSMYVLDDGRYGFPVVSVKEAMATASTDMADLAKTQIYRNIFVKGEQGFEKSAFMDILTSRDLAPIYSPVAPKIREDIVRLSGIGRTPDVRYRAEFFPWAMRFDLAYAEDGPLSYYSIVNLLAHAGFKVGLGEYRQEKGGTYGAFHPAEGNELKQVERWITAGPKQPVRPDVEGWINSVTGIKDVQDEAA